MTRNIRVWITLFAVSLVMLVICAAQGVRAQDQTPIAIGDTVKGTIKDSAYEQHYTLTAKADDTVTITMIADGTALDPYLLLQDSAGKTLAKDDDSAGEHNAQITFTFEKDGDYTVVATRFGQLSGPTTGDYSLTVKEGSTANATGAATVAATKEATSVATVAATVAATEEVALESSSTPTPLATVKPSSTPLSAATVAATEEATQEGLSLEEPTVTPTKLATRTRTPRPTPTEVVDEETPTEEPVAEEPTEEASATATRRPTRTRTPRPTPTEVVDEETPTEEPAAEEPTATVRPTRAPTRRPTRAAPTATPGVIINAGPISDGDSVTGEIDDTHIFYLYTYEGTTGENITLTMEAEGDLIPSVAVIPPTGTKALKVVTAKEGESKAALSITLPGDGRYVVVATRADSTSGTSSGSFTLTLSVGSAATGIDPAGDPPIVIGRLRDANLVPNGGRLLFNIPNNSFARVSTPGLHFLPIGGNSVAQNFVLNFRVVWNTAGDTSGCGIGFWVKSNQEGSFVLLTNDNKVALLQRQSQKFLINYVQDSSLFAPKDINVVTVIARGDEVTVYVNGQLQTTQKGKGLRGKFELETFNPEGNTVVTNCRYPSGWIWTFDK